MKPRTMPEIEIALKSSWMLSACMVMLSSVGLYVTTTYISDWRLRLVLVLWLLGTTIYYVLRDGLRRLPESWMRLHVSAHGELRLTNRGGMTFAPVLSDDTWVHPWLTVLNFERDGNRRFWHAGLPSLILLAQPDVDDFRRLRIWLRWWRHPQEGDLAAEP